MGKKICLLRQKVPLPTAKCDLLLCGSVSQRQTEEERWYGLQCYLIPRTQKETHLQLQEQRIPGEINTRSRQTARSACAQSARHRT